MTHANTPPPNDSWTGTWLTLAVLIALTIGGLGALGARSQSHAQQQPPRVLADSGAGAWAATHKALLGAADKLEVPTAISPAVGESTQAPAQAQVVAANARTGQPDQLPSVPPEQKVVIGLTSGVIGEVDPCG
jgi:hypothetical protein